RTKISSLHYLKDETFDYNLSLSVITPTSAGAWVTRNLGIESRIVQIQIINNTGAVRVIGVREVGSLATTFQAGTASCYLLVKTDSNGDIEIYSNNASVVFNTISII